MSDKNFFIGLVIGGVIGYLLAKRLLSKEIREEYKPYEYKEHICRWC